MLCGNTTPDALHSRIALVNAGCRQAGVTTFYETINVQYALSIYLIKSLTIATFTAEAVC